MRRNILIVVLLAAILLFTGCSVPTGKNSSDASSNDTQNGETSERLTTADNDASDETAENETVENGTVINETRSDVNTGNKKILITLYYQDSEGYVIPVTRKIEKQEGLARAAVNGLIDSPANREELEYFGLYPVLPQGNELLGITIKEGIAIVDFKPKFLDCGDETAERNMVSSLVYTLTEFKTINGVKILVNGYTVESMKYGTDISGILNRNNVLINAEKVNSDSGSGKLDIYLYKNVEDNYLYLLPVSIENPSLSDEELPGDIIKFLSEKYSDGQLNSEIPDTTKLINSSIDGNTLTLDFDEGIANYGGNAREDGILKQILYSMKQIDGIENVKILINGKKAELPEGTDISKAIPVPDRINDVIDN